LDEQDRAALPNSEPTPQEVLVETVREQYKDRLDTIEKELLAAEAYNDIGRVERLREEKEIVIAELKSHTGLHGRARTFPTDGEKARKAVAGAVRKALRNIGKHHPVMAEHLNQHLDLGGSCRYEADGVDWEF
jgi:hypothetical protein